jgi:hypothetical protein
VKAVMALGAIPMAPMSVVTPVSWRTPMTTSPGPMVVAPSPTPSHPNVTRHGATRCDFYYRSRHWWLHTNRGRRHYHWGRHRYSKVDSNVNARVCVYGGDSYNCQCQNCDCLFHNVYTLDANAGLNIITTGLPFCKGRAGMDEWRLPDSGLDCIDNW